MKIITNTVESGGLNEGILDSDILNTANITMEDMEGRLQDLNVDVANTSYLTKLENDKIMKIPNGLTNGFKESSDKSTLHKNGSSDFDEISEDDFHLELEASDEEINEVPLNTSSKCKETKKKEIIPKDVLEENLTPSVPIEKEDLLGIDEAEIVSENSNATESMVVGESDHVVIKVGSLLDCEESKKICSNEDQKTEETVTEDCFYAPAPNNSENTDEVIEVNVVFSEVVIGNVIDSSSEKPKERNVVEKSDESDLILCNEVKKTEVNETSLDDSEKSVKGNNLDNDLVIEKIVKTNLEDSLSEKCLSDSKLNKNMEVDLEINHSRDSLQSLSESSLDFQTKSFPLRKGTIKCNLDNNDINIIEEGIIENNVESRGIENSEEKSSLDKIVLNSNDDEPNELNNLRNDSDIDGNVTIVDIGVGDKSLQSVDLDLKEDTNLSLDSVCKENPNKDGKPTLTKSLSADEISLNDVIESVVENFEEQKDSFDDDDDFGNIIISSPREAKEMNLSLSFEEKKTLESTQESADTMNNSEEWMVLDELDDSFSSLDDQTDNITSCEIEEEQELEVEESAIDIEETDLIEVDESTSLELYPSDVINDCDTESFNEEVSNKDEEKSKHTDIDSNISNNEEVTNVDVEENSKEIESIILLNEEETNVDNEKAIFKEIDPIVLNNEESVSMDVEKSLPKEIDLIPLNNEEVNNMDIEEAVTTNDKINNIIVEESVTKDDEITPLNDEEVSNKDDSDLNNEDISNIDVEEPVNKDDKLTGLINIDGEQSIAEEIEPIVLNRDEFEEKSERRVDEVQVVGETIASVSKGDTNTDDISVDCKVVLKDYLREETTTNLEIDESFSISGKTESMDFDTSKKDDLLDNKTHTIVKYEESIVMCEEIEDRIDSEDKISALLIEELTSKIESEEILLKSDTVNQEDSEIVNSEDKISDRLGLEITKQFKTEESKQSNKEIQLVLPQISDFKESDANPTDSIISLGKTTKEAEEDLPVVLRKRSASYLDELEEVEAKRLKPVDETNLLEIEDDVSVPVVENNVDSTVSKLKRNNSNTEFELNIVKRPKLCKDGDDDLAICSDVVEDCLKFAETKNDESENLKELSVSNNVGSVKSVPEARNSSDSDISYIRNILKSSMDTVDNNRSNNKFRRKEEASDLELTLDKPKKMTVSNNSKQDDKQFHPKSITNLDLAIERVVEGANESPLNKMTLLKKFHKDQLKNLTRYDLEELVIVKLCEAITDRSVIGELRLRCHKVEQIHDQWRKKAFQLEKSHRELEMVLKRYLQEASNTKKERQPLPIKVTRSVGLQVVLATSIHGNAIRQKSSSSSTHQSSHHRKQPSVSNKPVNSSTPKSTLPICLRSRKIGNYQSHTPNMSDTEVKENDNPRVSWVYMLTKEELEEELKKSNLPTEGTVRDLRARLTKFIKRENLHPYQTPITEDIKPRNLVPGTSKPSKASLNQVVPQQTQSGLRVLTPKTNQVDLQSPVKTTVPPRSRPSLSAPPSPVTAAPSPKVNSHEVIDLTDKEEKNKQLLQKQQTQQQKLKQQLMQQQQQQKQKQQLLQQKQQQQKQLAQKNQLAQQNQQVKQLQQNQQVKQPSPLQKVQKQLQPKQSLQHTVGIRAPTTVSQNGIRLVQQLTSSTSPQGMAILVPTSAGQNGTTRSSQLFITAAPTTNQLRPVVQQNRPSPAASPLNISGNSTVLLRPSQLVPIQQTTTGALRSPPAALPIIPRGGIQQIKPPLQPIYKHPAPLPLNPQHPMKPGVKLPPPKPQLKIAKTVNGIMLSWSMTIGKDVADIASYQLYAYQESSQAPSTALWKKVGDVKALPLPMACTLTQFVEGHKYHFSVRAVDIHSRIGPFSVPGSILLTSGK